MAQLWLAVAAHHYGLSPIHTYSGGTEATAFNPRAVKAMQEIGFQIHTKASTDNNPLYLIRWTKGMQAYQAFSKPYYASPNPDSHFAAIMVCTQADETCPLVQGCDFRISLPYNDPKAFDHTQQESAKYTERCLQIGREMLFVMAMAQKQLA